MSSIRKFWSVGWLVLMFFLGSLGTVEAQTFAEWFAQKKTQKKYLLEQIAALQVYIGYARDGYKLVDGGLQTIRDITHGEFSLHDAFISGLKKVSPAVRGDVRVAEIIEMQVAVVKLFEGLRQSPLLSADELGYVALVFGEVVADGYTDLSELLLVVTSGKLEMDDAERFSRLDGIYGRMKDRLSFARGFGGQVDRLLLQKRSESDGLINLRRYYGIE